MARVLTPFLSTNWLDLRVLNIEAFKRESVSTMLNAVNIYAPSVKIRLYFYFSAPREGKKGKKGRGEWKDAHAIRDNIPFWLRGSPSRQWQF